jgi:hypothetical protein
MDGPRKSRPLRITRGHETNRLEDQVWALAYEQIWPVIRQALNSKRPSAEAEPEQAVGESAIAARRA